MKNWIVVIIDEYPAVTKYLSGFSFLEMSKNYYITRMLNAQKFAADL